MRTALLLVFVLTLAASAADKPHPSFDGKNLQNVDRWLSEELAELRRHETNEAAHDKALAALQKSLDTLVGQKVEWLAFVGLVRKSGEMHSRISYRAAHGGGDGSVYVHSADPKTGMDPVDYPDNSSQIVLPNSDYVLGLRADSHFLLCGTIKSVRVLLKDPKAPQSACYFLFRIADITMKDVKRPK